MAYDHARRRYELVVVMVRIAEEFNLKLRGSRRYKCRKLDIFSCIQLLTYSCSIVQGVVLTSTCARVKNLRFRHNLRKVGWKQVTDVPVYHIAPLF